jgi:hypothetical protein
MRFWRDLFYAVAAGAIIGTTIRRARERRALAQARAQAAQEPRPERRRRYFAWRQPPGNPGGRRAQPWRRPKRTL